MKCLTLKHGTEQAMCLTKSVVETLLIPQMHVYSIDKSGEPAQDEYGIPFIDNNRGTNLAENVHKQIVHLFGTWTTGVEMADYLLTQFRHCHNHRMSERRRNNFPKIYGEEEIKLFSLLIRTKCTDLNMDTMDIEWCKHLDGINIFPKLPAYLRKYLTTFQKNKFTRECDVIFLQQYNIVPYNSFFKYYCQCCTTGTSDCLTAPAHATLRSSRLETMFLLLLLI